MTSSHEPTMRSFPNWSDLLTRGAFWAGYLELFIELDEGLPVKLRAEDRPGLFRTTRVETEELWVRLHHTRERHGIVPAEDDPEICEEATRILGDLIHDDYHRRHVVKALTFRKYGPENIELPLEFGEGVQWRICFDPCPGEYHFLHDGSSEPLPLAGVDAHQRLPTLRFDETKRLARAEVSGVTSFQLALLLTPVMSIGPQDDEGELREWLRDQITLALPDVDGDEIARRFIVQYSEWRQHKELGWINDDECSYRNPDREAQSEWHACDGFERFTRFLDAFAGL